MTNDWQLQQAQNHLQDLVNQAKQSGPQHIVVHGKREAVVISETEYQQMTKKKLSFVDFMKQSPLAGLEISFDRDPSQTRDVDL